MWPIRLLVLLCGLFFWNASAFADGVLTGPASEGSGLPTGGSVNDCVVNTAPGIGTWQSCPGSVATDTLWDAAGDLAVGSGANTAARLAMGTALQVLRVNAGATGLEWAANSGSGLTHPQVMARTSMGF